MCHVDKVVLLQRVVVRQDRIGGHRLVEADVVGCFQVAVKVVALEAVADAILKRREEALVGMSNGALPDEEVAIKAVEGIAELHTCGVESGVPQFVNLYAMCYVVEEEDLFSKHRVGGLFDVDEAFGGRGVGVEGTAVGRTVAVAL